MTHHLIGIKPYKKFSNSAKALRKLLGLARYKETDTYTYLFNWGSQRKDNNARITFNKEEFICNASNKLKAFKIMSDNNIRIPKYTTNREEAKNLHFPVFCRTNHLMGGCGIKVALTPNDLIESDFYSEYIKPKDEFRVHIFKDEVIAWSKKIPKYEDTVPNLWIRNHSKGYKFSLCDNSRIYSKLKEFATLSVSSLGLDYGAVDIILGEDRKFYVLEVNTAMGVEGTTLNSYASKFREVIRNG